MFKPGVIPEMSIDIVGLIIGVILVIVWLVRLEAKANVNSEHIIEIKTIIIPKIEDRLDEAERKTETLDTRVMDKLSNIERILTERLAKIEGKLSQ